uniref:Protein aurora borealis n=1 Tax=Panagrolaimus sp. JU765 TaxID=591449 RepID=A0AC34QG85_9BILA
MAQKSTSYADASGDSGIHASEGSSIFDDSSKLKNKSNVTNPFDTQLSLLSTSCSPNMFKTPVSKPRQPTIFQWSIEQKSRMMPAIVDESFAYNSPKDSETDGIIERKLSEFWSQPLIDPSPEVVRTNPRVLDFSPSPIANVSFTRKLSTRQLEYNSTPISRKSSNQEVQTDVSLPVDFDFGSVVGPYLQTESSGIHISSTPKKNPHFNSTFPSPKRDFDDFRLDASLECDISFGESVFMRTEDDLSNVIDCKNPLEGSLLSPIKPDDLLLPELCQTKQQSPDLI